MPREWEETLAEDKDADDAAPGGTEARGRYSFEGKLGSGAMGVVYRAFDHVLERSVAMKALRAERMDEPAVQQRFMVEARAQAQLQHPHIVPILDVGYLADGRPYFTMPEVGGRRFDAVIQEVHDAARRTGGDVAVRRLVSVFSQACSAVAYAHSRGVLHRDLKPQNVLVGNFGEALVVDWGLARDEGKSRDCSDADPRLTRHGVVQGTPAYMSPEQASGHIDAIDARSDVYGLGAILFQILAGEPPFHGQSALAILERVRAGGPPKVPQSARGDIPEDLVDLCERSMARDAQERFQTVDELGREVLAWLDGERARDQARRMVRDALAGTELARERRVWAAALRADAEAELADIPTWKDQSDKAGAWEKESEADALDRAAALQDLTVDQGLHAALRLDPHLPEAHAALVERYRQRHAAAEQARDAEGLTRSEQLLRSHLAELPADHEVATRTASYLSGDGALTLFTDPPGAEVTLYRYEDHQRRLVERLVGVLGRTPFRTHALPMGSYVCRIRAPGRDEVRYPVHIGRQEHWHGTAPGEREPTPIWLPPTGFLGPDEVYVPAGWFRSGGDDEAHISHPARRLWCEALVVSRHPVVNEQYLDYLNALVAGGREGEAARNVPRARLSGAEQMGDILYGRDDAGRFELVRDMDGDLWLPRWPVMGIDWFAARDFCVWLSERTGRPWRLPGELEWEKAARGVDGRWFPWGDFADPSWCCIRDSREGRPMIDTIDAFPVDVSPYGVRHLGGNTRDWCADREGEIEGSRVKRPEAIEPDPIDQMVVRGGAWADDVRLARAADRSGRYANYSNLLTGIRTFYRLDERLDARDHDGRATSGSG